MLFSLQKLHRSAKLAQVPIPRICRKEDQLVKCAWHSNHQHQRTDGEVGFSSDGEHNFASSIFWHWRGTRSLMFGTCCPTQGVTVQHAIDQSNRNIIKLWNGVGFHRCEVRIINGIVLLRRQGNATIYKHTHGQRYCWISNLPGSMNIPVMELNSSKAGVARIAMAEYVI